MSSVDAVVAQYIDQYSASHYYLAFSGGLDSTVLLHALSQVLPAEKITSVHIHHGLLPEADAWAQHCESVCKTFGIICQVHHANLRLKSGDSVEDIARKARYHFFASVLHANDVLLTAHHADDQAETFILNALRGSGATGLAAMPVVKLLGEGRHGRPLLSLTRQELSDYALEHKLSWVEDPSNKDDRFNRNYLRKHIMPLLRARWPKMADTLSRSASLVGDNLDLLSELAALDTHIKPLQTEPLPTQSLRGLSQTRRFNALRYWLKQYGITQLSKAVLTEIDGAIFAEIDANPEIVLGGSIVRRYKETLYCMQVIENDTPQSYKWDLSKPLSINTQLTLQPEDLGEMLAPLRAENAVLQVRFRQGGERIRLAGREHQHQVKKLMQEYHVPPWLREQLPMVFYQDRLIAILGLSPAMPNILSQL